GGARGARSTRSARSRWHYGRPTWRARPPCGAPIRFRSKSPPSQRWKRRHWRVQPFPVQFVELTIHRIEEDKAVEPLQQRKLAHLHAHMGRASPNDELKVELLVGCPLHHVRNDQAVCREKIGLARNVGCGCGCMACGFISASPRSCVVPLA